MKKFVLTLICGGVALCLALDTVDARPKFPAVFAEKYPGVTLPAAKCNVCHPPAPAEKKMRNAYGAAVGEAIGKKNETDLAVVKEALGKVEAGNKEWAERLKAGKLPVE